LTLAIEPVTPRMIRLPSSAMNMMDDLGRFH
jgi:hypothetical protein